MSRSRRGCALLSLCVTLTACVYVPLRQRASYRIDQYFAAHPELAPATAQAIEAGHVIPGMDREQVWVVLGDPLRKSVFSLGRFEVWLYPATRLHQDQLHSHGAASFRLVFIEGRLAIIEPI